MTEVLFYHLEQASLEQVLPDLLEKSLERGWNAVVQASSDERIEALDQYLWTYKDDSFLAHGSAEDGHVELQPVFLTTDEDNPNAAEVRFFVDGAGAENVSDYKRVVHLFDGRDNDAVAAARASWKQASKEGFDVTYWQQNEQGRWEKKA
jgi:DNA polymerase-3 subunit chi